MIFCHPTMACSGCTDLIDEKVYTTILVPFLETVFLTRNIPQQSTIKLSGHRLEARTLPSHHQCTKQRNFHCHHLMVLAVFRFSRTLCYQQDLEPVDLDGCHQQRQRLRSRSGMAKPAIFKVFLKTHLVTSNLLL